MGQNVSIGFVNQPGIHWQDAVRFAQRNGFDHIEFIMDGTTSRKTLLDTAETVIEAMDEADLDLMFHFPWSLDIGSEHEYVRDGAIEELEACIDVAERLGALKGVVHADSDPWSTGADPEAIQDNILTAAQTLHNYGRDRDIEVCIENIPSQWFDTYDFERFFAETDASMTFDTGHARRDGMMAEEMAAFIHDHRGRITHMHINDVMIGEIEHVPVGAGTLDFETALEPVQDYWGGSMSIEPFTYSTTYLRHSKNHLENVLKRH